MKKIVLILLTLSFSLSASANWLRKSTISEVINNTDFVGDTLEDVLFSLSAGLNVSKVKASLDLNGSGANCTFKIPEGSLLFGISYRIDKDIVYDIGPSTIIRFIGGSSEIVTSSLAGNFNEKESKVIPDFIITSGGDTDVEIVPDSGDFISGAISIVVYYVHIPELVDLIPTETPTNTPEPTETPEPMETPTETPIPPSPTST